MFSVFTLSVTTVRAQDNSDYYQTDYLRYENHIYVPNIKTVLFEQLNVHLTDPVIELASGQKLLLSFDDLDADYKYYTYTLIHCDADWRPSNLIQNEYLEGFTEDRIINYRSSFNTIQKYTHYWQEIPGREVKPFISGNYLVKVYVEGEPDKPVLTRRMLVVQPKAFIEGTVKRATIVQDRESKHEIDFNITYAGLQIANPFEDVKVVLMQNSRWDNAIRGLKPLFLKENMLEYNYEGENTFNAGNEFRTFDTRTVRIYTEFVKEIVQGPDGYTIVLQPCISRSFDRYVFENDINGKYLIKNQDGRDNELESEYVNVKFTLRHDVLANGNFYIFGALTDWALNNSNKMEYNYDENSYEALLYVKQGYYNYEFAFLKDGENVADETVVEGNHYETRNEYTILVYFRPVGGRYDQLVGLTKLYSR